MKFRYLHSPQSAQGAYSDKIVYLPCIPVCVSLGGITTPEFPVIVDSAASLTFFGFWLAEQVFGIDPLEGTEIPICGVGGNDKGYLHDRGFKITLAGHSFVARICFMETLQPGIGLLGREGLFDHFKISFNEKKRIVELKSYEQK